jgi:hypothetical protein
MVHELRPRYIWLPKQFLPPLLAVIPVRVHRTTAKKEPGFRHGRLGRQSLSRGISLSLKILIDKIGKCARLGFGEYAGWVMHPGYEKCMVGVNAEADSIWA